MGEVYSFAIHSDSGVVLFETGIGEGNEYIERAYRPVRRPLLGSLREHGIHRDDVVAIANSHLHFDHCGGNPLFPGVPIFAQARELEAAREPQYTVAEWVDFPGSNVVSIGGAQAIAPGVTIVPTPGHSIGHQSLQLETGDGLIILAGQAIYDEAECAYIHANGALPPGRTPESYPDEHIGSARRLLQSRPVRVHFSHDASVWRADS